ncbi:MAG: Xaa-Pro peptidase family protein [Planctomycetota bacterium]|jgi:Xaa-Pro aminopeptidase|nr:Xaa-Pro peptidase family protein [Planctomycetota bacterium]MDP6762650.1 Xaa-Pro peptidase family protein [Planctomycetota bacterium]MDP6990281.1 Xaa-Pro peptidase family protein [Planctomycetota bacterium]
MTNSIPIAVAAALALAGLSPSSPAVQESEPAASPPRAAVCGLGKEFHASRRARLREELAEGVFVIRGLGETRGYHAFRQDKTFWYLTGIESPGAALLMDIESGREVLFLRDANPWKEAWEGELWDVGDEWVEPVTGFAEVRSNKELDEALEEMAGADRVVWISMHPYIELGDCFDRAIPADRARAADPLDGRASRERAFRAALAERLGREPRDATSALNELRRVKTPEEVEAMRRAALAGVAGMNEAIRSTRPGLGEWDLDALMGWMHRRAGAAGAAYHPIVGSGPNSLILHYSANDRVMRDGDVVLIDYGPEFDHYTTDITRTWPVGGRFTERQAELYDAVLAAQQAGIQAARPGARMADVNAACTQVLRERGFGDLLAHAATHYIGMEVHDVGSARKPLEVGVAFTIEPGLYEKETAIGIRIEDVVVITAEGCEVITGAIPRAREDIEALWNERGVLDALAEGR